MPDLKIIFMQKVVGSGVDLDIQDFQLNSFLALPMIESDMVGEISPVIFLKGRIEMSHIEGNGLKGDMILTHIKFKVFSL